jgi:DNA invertase Pin-like site-specific DNA recombinase
MAVVGYARVSSTDQDLSIQLEALKAAGCCKRVWSEKASGTSRNGRKELEALLDYVREGDTWSALA